jgi:hypothetical protein
VTRPTSDVVRPKIRAIYATPGGGAGCCLHCQLDDGNLENRFFDAETRADINPEHPLCLEVFDLLAAMRITARRKACQTEAGAP